MEEIIKLLECPVCFQHSISDTYLQCRNGHSGCLECYSRLKNCPICRTLLSIPTIKTFSKETTTAFQLRYFQVTKIGHGTALLKALTYHFKCTLCNQIPTRRNIWQCREGHIKCSECQNPPMKVSECHLCEDACRMSKHFCRKTCLAGDQELSVRGSRVQSCHPGFDKPRERRVRLS